jgi:hypothetical protein
LAQRRYCRQGIVPSKPSAPKPAKKIKKLKVQGKAPITGKKRAREFGMDEGSDLESEAVAGEEGVLSLEAYNLDGAADTNLAFAGDDLAALQLAPEAPKSTVKKSKKIKVTSKVGAKGWPGTEGAVDDTTLGSEDV